MDMKVVINTCYYTSEYIDAIKNLFNLAGFYVDDHYGEMGDEEGDLAIYAYQGDLKTQITILEVFKNCDLI